MNTFSTYQDKVLEEWNEYGMHKIYDINKSNTAITSNNQNQDKFIFYDGPPFCSGNLHIAHCAIGTIKSTMLNYKAMMGFQCTNKLGYDCHGLPIESVANKALGIATLEDLERVGLVKFNDFCKETIKSCERDWEPIYNRMGRWADFNNVYKTMDMSFMESVWWAFAELYKKGLIYRGYKITPYSYTLQSPLSNFEASQNYKEVDCKSIYVRFELLLSPQSQITINKPTYLVAWTTTPWTLPANIALCVNAELDYEYLEDTQGNIYILGKDKYKNANIKIKHIIKTVKGVELIGLQYKPLYNTYENIIITQNVNANANNLFHTVIADNYVKESGTTGTNIVHLAPVFGEDDYRVCHEKGLIDDKNADANTQTQTKIIVKNLEIIDCNCKYLPTVEQYSGMLVFDAEPLIIKELKEHKALLKMQQIRHEYPHCYRTDTPLVYRTCDSFYVDIQKIKDRMIELNKDINWYPENIGSQRFHKWLEGAKDWCISRSRYFGTPIPVWIAYDCNGNCDDIIVIGSIEELQKLSQSNDIITDIHPEFVNNIIITNSQNGKTYRRVPDIFDCWFESGSVPFAQYHYPFENKIEFEEQYQSPTNKFSGLSDFIVEGLDQTRGWFYTLLVLSTALFDKKPANNIMAVGMILDENRKKISKKTKNYVDPLILIDRYGADSIRLYLLQSQISNAEPLAFKEDDIKLINKTLFQFKNCVDFLQEHITNQKHQEIQFDILAYQHTTNSMDKWIIHHTNNIQSQVIQFMDGYQISKATRMIIDLIEDITNWYLKFNRDRLKGKSTHHEWIISTSTLYQIIKQYVILLAPFAPFITQSIYKQLTQIDSNLLMFVHLEKYNIYIPLNSGNYDNSDNSDNDDNGSNSDKNNYIETFELLKRVSKLVRGARMNTTTHTSSKTPIKSCEICMDSAISLKQIASCIDLIQSELNIIDIKYSSLTGKFCYRMLPNKAILGKKYRQKSNDIYKAMEIQNHWVADNSLKQFTLFVPINTNVGNIDTIELDEYILEEGEFILEPLFNPNDIFDIDSQKANNITNNILVRIDFTYDIQIEKLSHLKRFVSEIQQVRKHMGLKPWNKIAIHIYKDDFDIVSNNVEYIRKRLECDVIPNSLCKINGINLKCYMSEQFENEDNSNNQDTNTLQNKQIVYAVLLLDC